MSDLTQEQIDNYSAMVLGVMKQVVDKDTADHLWFDIEQQGWVIVLEALGTYDPEQGTKPETWVYRHLKWNLPKWIEREMHHETDRHYPDWEEVSLDDLIEMNEVEQYIDFDAEQHLQNQVDVYALAQGLDEEEVAVIGCLYYEDLSEREAAEKLGVGRKKIRLVRDRALQKMSEAGAQNQEKLT